MHKVINIIKKCVKQIIFFVLLLLTFSLIWAEGRYGNIGFDEIVFHLNMPLKGVAQDYISSYVLGAVRPTCVLFVVEIGIVVLIS